MKVFGLGLMERPGQTVVALMRKGKCWSPAHDGLQKIRKAGEQKIACQQEIISGHLILALRAKTLFADLTHLK